MQRLESSTGYGQWVLCQNPGVSKTSLPRHQLQQVVLAVGIAFLVAGAAAFYFIEGRSLLESVYMVVITLTTVGYGTPRELTPSGTVISIVVIVVGVPAALYSITQFAEYLVTGVVRGEIGTARTRRRIRRLNAHTIICGFGRLGSELAHQLTSDGRQIVVIDPDETGAARSRNAGYPTIAGDASEDEILGEAGIENAASLVAAVGSDSVNAFVTLSARALSPQIQIISRAEQNAAVEKLLRAGANDAITPYAAGSRAIATKLTAPLVGLVVEALLDDQVGSISMKQLRVHPRSRLVGESVGQLLREPDTNLRVLALGQGVNNVELLPGPQTRIGGGDLIVAVGSPASLAAIAGAADSILGND